MSLVHSVAAAIAANLGRIREINQRYAAPRIQMSPPVRLSLLVLRVYLFVLVGLLVYKFVTILIR